MTTATSVTQALWQHIYGEQTGYLCLFSGRRAAPGEQQLNDPRQEWYRWPNDADRAESDLLRLSGMGRETYTCAHLLIERVRSAKTAAPIWTLYADLDGAPVPTTFPQPTALVESSPERHQGYWRLTRGIPPDQAEALNQRLTQAIGADPSGYDLTQVLRPPGTTSYKRAAPFVVRLVHLDATRTVDPDELARLLPPLPTAPPARPPHRTTPTRPTGETAALLNHALEADAKFRRLNDGDIADYPSQSQADSAYCCKAIWWTDHDRTLTDSWFRQSRLFRSKWDEVHFADGSTYGAKTIERADGFVQGGYEPQRASLKFTMAEGKTLGADDQSSGLPPRNEPPGTAATPPHPADNLNTDLGNAQRLVGQHGADIRYITTFKRWTEWDGQRWELSESEGIMHRAKQTVRAMYAEASAIVDDDRATKLVKHAIASQAAGRLEAMVKLARSEKAIEVRHSQLDCDPWLLSVANGTLNLQTGALREHRRADLITHALTTPYDPHATCPNWLTFLDRITNGDASLVEFLQRAVGYSLTGSTDERVFFLLHGTGTNGKTTFLETIALLLGELALRTSVETLLVKRHEGINNEVARLRGARFVHTSESDEGKRLAEGLIKDLTGGDTISARFLYAEPFQFSPTFKIWFATNHKPMIRGTDNAIWNRVRLIPFTVTIPGTEIVSKEVLIGRHRAELPGILAWAVQGCLAWHRAGTLAAPEAVLAATAGYRQEMDTFAAFLDEECVINRMATVATSDLYATYSEWAKANTEEGPINQRAFGTRLKDHGDFTPGKGTGGVRYWHGLRLIRERTTPTQARSRGE